MPDQNDDVRDANTPSRNERDHAYSGEEPRPFNPSHEYSSWQYPSSWSRERLPRQGRYVGLGPKGYRRSDERIHEEVSDRLMAHPDVDASDIEVHVANGVVTLTGSVDDRHQKRVAEFIAEDAIGVEDVQNQLQVRHRFWSRLGGERVQQHEIDREHTREVAAPSTLGSRANAARAAARREEEAR